VKHWNKDTKENEENPKVDSFIDDIIRVYKKHDMSISHEDSHGAFIVTDLTNYNILWLKEAMVSGKSVNIGKPKVTKERPPVKPKAGFKFHKESQTSKSKTGFKFFKE